MKWKRAVYRGFRSGDYVVEARMSGSQSVTVWRLRKGSKHIGHFDTARAAKAYAEVGGDRNWKLYLTAEERRDICRENNSWPECHVARVRGDKIDGARMIELSCGHTVLRRRAPRLQATVVCERCAAGESR